jgi:magnesium chelatase family protein
MIKIQSLIQDKNKLLPIEVELTLWPGLPGIQFLGLPDQHLKESAFRIKSAIKHSGFQFPVSQQILVNLRPSHLKKTSRGLELAVAAAYLWETGQLRAPLASSDFFIYGELSLSGEVLEPEDLASLERRHSVVLTGQAASESRTPFRKQVIQTLKDLENPIEIQAQMQEQMPERPTELIQATFSEAQGRLLEILAVGEHSALLAGPAGSGKTTVARALPGFLREPSMEEFQNLRKIHFEFGDKLRWRPTVKPHHSTPIMAMIGGGQVPFAGEISRAHGGVLILDELLEFASPVQEALREPMEEGKMRVFRNGKLKEYPAQAQIVATTNLCPCGDWTPLRSKERFCAFSAIRCKSYSSRLSGPLVDRFEILEFTEKIGELKVRGTDLLTRIQKAQEFSKAAYPGPVNSKKAFHDIMKNLNPAARRIAELDEDSSQRRKLAVLRLARTLADLDFESVIKSCHLDEAILSARDHFKKLKRWE